jgi:hypothetical protein
MAKKPTPEAQKLLLAHVHSILDSHKRENNDFRNKLEIIDLAYARYKTVAEAANTQDGVDLAKYVRNEAESMRQLPSNLRPPIVASQVGSAHGYLTDVFLSGSPIFPVVSTPTNKDDAEKLESIIANHSILGGYPRQLLIFLLDCAKYNFGAIEMAWTSLESYRAEADLTQVEDGSKLEAESNNYTRVRRLDPYNTIWDESVSPGDVAALGDYAGDVEIISHARLRKELAQLPEHAVNQKKAINSKTTQAHRVFQPHPNLSDYVSTTEDMDWLAWMQGGTTKRYADVNYANRAERVTLYIRIAPEDFKLDDPEPKTPHVYKVVVVNYEHLVLVERAYTPLDSLPVLIGSPIEDGLRLQTQGIAEASIPIQEAASTLFDIRFNAARRSVSDRAIYNQEMIDPDDVNASVPAPKIPAKVNSLLNQTLDNAYKAIPFDSRGTETALQDAVMVSEWAKDLFGQNKVSQGQFQKGNKSVQEFDTVMGNAESRMRMPALSLEYQVFVPLKQILKLNIFRHFGTMKVPHHMTGEGMDVDIRKLREKVLEFRLADGFTPKSKMANTDMLGQGLTLISTSPILQQAYGGHLPAMFAHLMSLGGVKGLEQYNPQAQQQGELANEQQQPQPPGVPGPPAPGQNGGGPPGAAPI